MDLKRIPWFALITVFMLVSMTMYGQKFFIDILATYLTEALLYLALAYALWNPRRHESPALLLMAVVWLTNQVVIWASNYPLNWFVLTGNNFRIFDYSLMMVQVVLFIFLLSKSKGSTSAMWTNSALGVTFIFGLSKIIQSVGAAPAWGGVVNWGYWSLGWGLAITLISGGYIWSLMTKRKMVWVLVIAGALLVAVIAIGIKDIGLQLI